MCYNALSFRMTAHLLLFYLQSIILWHFIYEKIVKAIFFKMSYCFKEQFISCPHPSRLWVYLVRFISEGQWLACPLNKHSLANKNKEHKYAIQKYTALFKNSNTHFCWNWEEGTGLQRQQSTEECYVVLEVRIRGLEIYDKWFICFRLFL